MGVKGSMGERRRRTGGAGGVGGSSRTCLWRVWVGGRGAVLGRRGTSGDVGWRWQVAQQHTQEREDTPMRGGGSEGG